MAQPKPWTPDSLLEAVRQYQLPAVIMAAAELNIFSQLNGQARSATDIAKRLKCDKRAMEMLLGAAVAGGLVVKSSGKYKLAAGVSDLLVEGRPKNVLGMVRHQANCYRRWGDLALSVQSGRPAERRPSVRGDTQDLASFIEAMHNVSAPVAGKVIRAIRPLKFKKLLDIGGASGTWTIEFLKACRSGRAVLFDLPEVIPLAKMRLRSMGFEKRVDLDFGDYDKDAFATGCDLAWLSAIMHQNSMAENLSLFRRVHDALVPGGRIAIRDIVMNEDRVSPPAGAFFAVNMLVGTEAGGTFTFFEMAEALNEAGFENVRLARRDPGMHAIIVATRPVQGRSKAR